MDQQLLFLINRAWINPVADRVMALASCWDAWLPIAVILLIILVVKGQFRERAYAVSLLIIVGLNDGLISNSLKHWIARPRPHQAMAGVRVVDLKNAHPRILAIFSPAQVKRSAEPGIDRGEGRSFPSSHTVNVCSVAFVSVAFFGACAAWTFAFAGLVSYSRIYVGAHWPSDVAASIFIGVGSSLLLLALLEMLWRRAGARWLPAIHERHPRLFAA